MAFEWSDKMSVGMDEIDEQHKMFFVFVKRLADIQILEDDDAKKTFTDNLEFFKKYAMEHFDIEEKLMENSSYPNAHAHCQMHIDFIQKYTEMMDEFTSTGPSPVLAEKIVNNAYDWLVSHISKMDVDYVKHIKSLEK